MMLRCAACISSGSAIANALSAASRSPFLIASSTVRTEPRIWVRRDLLTMVRRAILRVAFLAEVVLAMSQISFGSDLVADGLPECRPLNCAGVVCGCSAKMPSRSEQAHKAMALKEHRRQDCARRHCRSYKEPRMQRQRFRLGWGPNKRPARGG